MEDSTRKTRKYGQKELLSKDLVEVFEPKNKQVVSEAFKLTQDKFYLEQLENFKQKSKDALFLFQDQRAGVILTPDDGGTKYRNLIQEHERLRKIKQA